MRPEYPPLNLASRRSQKNAGEISTKIVTFTGVGEFDGIRERAQRAFHG